MKNVQMSALGNYQIGFQAKNNIVNLAKDSIKANATRYFRNIDGYEKSVLTSEEAEKVQSMLNKHLQKPERIEIKSLDGDTLFISNPTKEELAQLSKKAKQDLDEAAQIIRVRESSLGFQPHPWDKYVDNV